MLHVPWHNVWIQKLDYVITVLKITSAVVQVLQHVRAVQKEWFLRHHMTEKCVCNIGLEVQKDRTCGPCPPGKHNPFAGDFCRPCSDEDFKSGTNTNRCLSRPPGTFSKKNALKWLPYPKGFTPLTGPPIHFNNIAQMSIDVCRSEISGSGVHWGLN